MPKVSVIMPSLNVARYIRKCLESVINQTLKDIEIIVVDAGSDDGTLEIVKEYAELDARILIIHSAVRSYGKQMNMGIAVASGEYIGIVETDDYIDEKMFDSLVSAADKYHADYVKGYARAFFDLPNGERYEYDLDRYDFGRDEYVYSPKCRPEMLLSEYYIWLGLYRRDFLDDIKFNESLGASFQDIGFIVQSLIMAKCAVYIDVPVYWYRRSNENSSVYNPHGFKYLVGEYEWNKRFLYRMTDLEKKYFYLRFFGQCLGRFQLMTITKNDWGNIEHEVNFFRDEFERAVEKNIVSFDGTYRELYALLKLFLVKPMAALEFYQEEYTAKFLKLNTMILWCGKKRVIIWGTGKYGCFIHAAIVRHSKVTVVGFLDNNPKFWGEYVQGVFVYNPAEIESMRSDAVFIIAVKNHVAEIQSRLLEMGIDDERIYVDLSFKDPMLVL